jgi:hypothetical protein
MARGYDLISTPASACCASRSGPTTPTRDGSYYINAEVRIGKNRRRYAGGETEFLCTAAMPLDPLEVEYPCGLKSFMPSGYSKFPNNRLPHAMRRNS